MGKDEELSTKSLTVVGIGASAGGLSALKEFFTCLPEKTGMAFVIVVHLSPDHSSHLADLLQSSLKIPVQQVNKTIELKADHAYVIPPGSNLSAIDTHLRLTKLEVKRRERAPIDHFFRTLASSYDGNSIGIILTGTGSDGTLGLREIHQKGGLTIVQDPDEAEYDGMPRSAISTGIIDLVLPVKEIPKAIVEYNQTEPEITGKEGDHDHSSEEKQLLRKIFSLILSRTGRSYEGYKHSTMFRRITKRMQLLQLENLSDYVKYLSTNNTEIQSLSDDLLINVTNFFRDKNVFDYLAKEVVPALFDNKSPEETIRVWSAGCSTGEEAYSLAMLIMEESSRRDNPPRIQIFASDLHEHSLARAREGFYLGDIETDVSPERIKRFFVKHDNGFKVKKGIRELVIFSPHNLLKDPPFSKIDLISCRNVLIYLQRPVQRNVFSLFHYSIRSNGYLLLGTSESMEGFDIFKLKDKDAGVFQKRNFQTRELTLPQFQDFPMHAGSDLLSGDQEPLAYGAIHYNMVERLAPPSVLVSTEDQIIHYSQRSGRFFVHPGGVPTNNLYKLIRPELHVELRAMLESAREQQVRQSSSPIAVQINGNEVQVVLHAYPSQKPNEDGFVLVIFDERAPYDVVKLNSPIDNEVIHVSDYSDKGRDDLEQELYQTKLRLNFVVEQYEASKDEMRISYEELQSANEELRSTMEELETSKEELQSMNEELQTVNQENRHKVDELAMLSSDLQNVFNSTDIATLFLDRELRILRYTNKVEELFNVRNTDRGRPISDITNRLGYPELEKDALNVLKSLIPNERELKEVSGQWYLTRILPYRSLEDHIDGIVITLVNITDQKKLEEQLRHAKEEAENAARAKESFLAHMSHEIRTPLNAIIALSSILMEQKHSPEQEDHLETLRYSADNLRLLINNILDFSKLQSGKDVLTPVDFSIKEMVESLSKIHGPRAQEQQNKVEIHLDKKVPSMVSGDKLKLFQVLNNLVGNAIKFTRKGLVSIRVHYKEKKGDSHLIHFEVIDTGKGIPDSKISEIFDAFVQADSSATRMYEGTGLGLSISKLLVEIMGGELKVSSEIDEGSTFSFQIELMGSRIRKMKKKENTSLLTQSKNWKILIVEDIELNRKLVRLFLKQWWNITPDEAANGKQSLAMVAKRQYDLILLDVRMPEMNGYTAVTQIRTHSNYLHTPILALTADTEEEVKKHPESQLFTDVIVKPFEPANLYNKILLYLQENNPDSDKTSNDKFSRKKKLVSSENELIEMIGDDPADIKNFYQSVLENLPVARKSFKKAVDDRDITALKDLIHKKTMIINLMRFNKLSGLLEKTENLLKHGPDKDIESCKNEVLAHFNELESSLKISNPLINYYYE